MVTPKVFVTISIIPQALTIINIPIIPQIIWFRPVLLASSLSEPLIKSTTPQKNITKDKVNKSKIKGAIIWLLKLDIRVSVVIYYYDYTVGSPGTLGIVLSKLSVSDNTPTNPQTEIITKRITIPQII